MMTAAWYMQVVVAGRISTRHVDAATPPVGKSKNPEKFQTLKNMHSTAVLCCHTRHSPAVPGIEGLCPFCSVSTVLC